MADVVLTLGDFEFADFEIPDNITVGGNQRLVTHGLVGGINVIDSMGGNDGPIEWSGVLLYDGAVARYQELDRMRLAGEALQLAWGEFLYLVVISDFRADYRYQYHIPYRISCAVIENLTLGTRAEGDPDIDDTIAGDFTAANSLTSLINNPTLTGLMATVNSAQSAVSSFARASSATLNGILGPLAAARTQITSLISSTGNTIAGIASIGGVLPNNPIAVNAANLTSQLGAFNTLPSLYNLQSITGRLNTNITTLSAAQKLLGN